jgi:hypothetical protein
MDIPTEEVVFVIGHRVFGDQLDMPLTLPMSATNRLPRLDGPTFTSVGGRLTALFNDAANVAWGALLPKCTTGNCAGGPAPGPHRTPSRTSRVNSARSSALRSETAQKFNPPAAQWAKL